MKNKNIILSWDEFKKRISAHIQGNLGPRICRGQSNSNWDLATTLHRSSSNIDLTEYFQMVNHLADVVGTIEKRFIDVNDNESFASFLAYLQHHGFPTPLLDWTFSPYIAAYFAFSGVISSNSKPDYVSIYVFDHLKWATHYEQVSDYHTVQPHVSVFQPKAHGNVRQLNQQGYLYLRTNVINIEEHIRNCEAYAGTTFLDVYCIHANEGFDVMTDLELMGITDYSLFGTIDSLCKFYKNSLFNRDNFGRTTNDRLAHVIQQNIQLNANKRSILDAL